MTIFNDKYVRIVGPLVLFLIGTSFFRLDWYFELSMSRIIRMDLIGISAGYICWNLTRWIIRSVQKRYPGIDHTRQRLWWMALFMPLLVNFAWCIRQLAHIVFNGASGLLEPFPEYIYSVGIQLFYHCVYYVIYEGSYIMGAWRQAYEQNEQFKKNSLQHQLDSLKSRVNPHFLFNSLNSLSMLIDENPRQAETFIDELSQVYRYLLRTNEQELTTLGQELQFIRSYFQLLKTRYGSGVQLRVSVSEEKLEQAIPPLTLQLLVENAVKHNIILARRPLLIEIKIQGSALVVQNNLQRKTIAVPSNKVGLASIAAKYQLLAHRDIAVYEDEQHFVVELPLLTAQPQPNMIP